MAGYIGTQAVSVNTTSATISDDLAVGDDATIAGTALVTGVLTTTAATVFNGGFASNAASTISTADNLAQLKLISTDADENSGPRIHLERNSGSPADGDTGGIIEFSADNDAGEMSDFARIRLHLDDVSNGTEDGNLKFFTLVAGTEVSRMGLASSETVFNEDSADLDFRVESDNLTNALFVQGSDGYVGIGTTTPVRQLSLVNSGSAEMSLISGTSNQCSILMGDSASGVALYRGYLQYNNATDDMLIAASSRTCIAILSGGNIEIQGNGDQARILPQSDNAGLLGQSSNRWQAVYAVNGAIQTSDQRQKTEIQDSSLGLDFIKALRPVSYKWISGGKHFEYAEGDEVEQKSPTITDVAGVRNHYGLLAQEVKTVLGDTDFGGWVLDDVDDADSVQSLRYDQFVAPLIKAIQEQNALIEALTARVATLEG